MKEKTLGMMISSLRKETGMTQLELAEKMGVTDKAVSKWERDLSCPDVNAIPKLADILGVSVDELMRNRLEPQREEGKDLTPTGRDRVNATKMGYLAVELLLQGKTNRIVCTHDGGFTDVDIDEGLSMQKNIQKMEVDVLAAMTGI